MVAITGVSLSAIAEFAIGSGQWATEKGGYDHVPTGLVRQQNLAGIIAATSSEAHRDFSSWEGGLYVCPPRRARRGIVEVTA